MSRYTLIKGAFPIVGTQPDGDTIRFQPDDPAIVAGLGPDGQRPAFSRGGTQISVRLEGVDALETHFGGTRQQVAFGDLATARMLTALGFDRVATAGTKVTATTPVAARGFVLANGLDSYGRMIAFVFAGEDGSVDGAPVFLDTPTLARSVNARLLAEGVAYPAFYSTLPVDLRDYLAAQTRLVRERAAGLWPLDAPSVDRAADIPDLAAAEALVMWPKLFRRLVEYFKGGRPGLAGFDAWLREDRRNRDDYLLLPGGELGAMHDLIAVDGDSMRLRFRPEDVVVLPDSFTEQPNPRPLPEPAPDAEVPVTPVPTPVPELDAPLRIVAAMFNPVGDDAGGETVTIVNLSPASVSLAGWRIADRALDAAGRPGQPLSGALAAGDALRVALRSPIQLGNAGDDLLLVDPEGRVAHRVGYARGAADAPGTTVLF